MLLTIPNRDIIGKVVEYFRRLNRAARSNIEFVANVRSPMNSKPSPSDQKKLAQIRKALDNLHPAQRLRVAKELQARRAKTQAS